MPSIFAADSIVKSFGSTAVLKGASIWATPGKITVLLGRNGCGKSTLLRVGAGVIRPDAGAVHFEGKCYLRPRLHQLAARGLFFLPQDRLLTSRLTLRGHFDAVRWRFGDAVSEEVLSDLELRPLLGHRPHDLSGGERRRAEFAIAMLRSPRCLLADEPFVGINPRTAELVADALKKLKNLGCAVVITGHDVQHLMAIADDVVWMVGGTTHGIGSAREAMQHEQFRREYLGPGRLTI